VTVCPLAKSNDSKKVEMTHKRQQQAAQRHGTLFGVVKTFSPKCTHNSERKLGSTKNDHHWERLVLVSTPFCHQEATRLWRIYAVQHNR